MEQINIEAVYQNGTLKLPRELPLQEGQKVTITIHPAGSVGTRGTTPRSAAPASSTGTTRNRSARSTTWSIAMGCEASGCGR